MVLEIVRIDISGCVVLSDHYPVIKKNAKYNAKKRGKQKQLTVMRDLRYSVGMGVGGDE